MPNMTEGYSVTCRAQFIMKMVTTQLLITQGICPERQEVTEDISLMARMLVSWSKDPGHKF